MPLQPYLFFDGRCEEAIDFYKAKLGAEVKMLMRFSESPEPHPPGRLPPGAENKVMHAELSIAGNTVLCSDGHCQGKPSFQGFALTIIVPSAADADRVFAGLNDGGEVRMPLAKTFFSARFGMVQDRFGVSWMVYVAK
ncbi:MAG: VOC family protein [Planctomycetes bacterium]|nr:VOC family protein [Planctomycetota bacterium]